MTALGQQRQVARRVTWVRGGRACAAQTHCQHCAGRGRGCHGVVWSPAGVWPHRWLRRAAVAAVCGSGGGAGVVAAVWALGRHWLPGCWFLPLCLPAWVWLGPARSTHPAAPLPLSSCCCCCWSRSCRCRCCRRWWWWWWLHAGTLLPATARCPRRHTVNTPTHGNADAPSNTMALLLSSMAQCHTCR